MLTASSDWSFTHLVNDTHDLGPWLFLGMFCTAVLVIMTVLDIIKRSPWAIFTVLGLLGITLIITSVTGALCITGGTVVIAILVRVITDVRDATDTTDTAEKTRL